MDKDKPHKLAFDPACWAFPRAARRISPAAASSGWQVLTAAWTNRVSHKLIVCVVNQLTTHHGLDVKYANYEFNPNVDQLMLKNGIRFVTPFSERTTGDFFVIETNFLKEAAVKNFTTFGGEHLLSYHAEGEPRVRRQLRHRQRLPFLVRRPVLCLEILTGRRASPPPVADRRCFSFRLIS